MFLEAFSSPAPAVKGSGILSHLHMQICRYDLAEVKADYEPVREKRVGG
jgi:hypothetical protein